MAHSLNNVAETLPRCYGRGMTQQATRYDIEIQVENTTIEGTLNGEQVLELRKTLQQAKTNMIEIPLTQTYLEEEKEVSVFLNPQHLHYIHIEES